MGRRFAIAALVALRAAVAAVAAGGGGGRARGRATRRAQADAAAGEPQRRSNRRSDALLAQDDDRREARAAARCSPTVRSPTPRPRRPASAASSASPTRRRSTTSSTSRSSSRGCTSRSCSPSTRSTASARSSRSRSATARSFDPGVATADHTIGARETAAVGIKQIYSPMVDVSHEPRWGRIAEGAGEDPYLGSVMAAARVQRRRARTTARPDKVVTSVKHFAAYGQPEGGRDYNTTDMSRAAAVQHVPAAVQGRGRRRRRHRRCARSTRSTASPAARTARPRRTSSRASGASTASSRATTRRSPSCAPARRRTRTAGPCGHGVAADGADAAQAALNAGTDSEMVCTNFATSASSCVAQQPDLDGADRRRGAPHPARQVPRRPVRAPVRRPGADAEQAAAARRPRGRARRGGQVDGAAQERQTGGNPTCRSTRQVDRGDRPARRRPARHARPVVGPGPGRGRRLAVHRHQGAGPEHDDSRRAARSATTTSPTPPTSARTPGLRRRGGRGQRGRPGRPRARRDARDERRGRVAQQHRPARPAAGADRRDQGDRQAVRRRAVQRPPADADQGRRRASPAILEAWFPGVEAGNAVADVLFGKVNPGGKLPVTFPRNVGQVPIYYNHEPTGRPCDTTQKYNSRYRDIPTCEPLYAFGYGLSYTTFEVSNLQLSSATMQPQRQRHGERRRQEHRHRVRATTSSSSTSTTRWRASRSRCAACAASSA